MFFVMCTAVPNKNNHTRSCRDPETTVNHFWSPGGVWRMPPPLSVSTADTASAAAAAAAVSAGAAAIAAV